MSIDFDAIHHRLGHLEQVVAVMAMNIDTNLPAAGLGSLIDSATNDLQNTLSNMTLDYIESVTDHAKGSARAGHYWSNSLLHYMDYHVFLKSFVSMLSNQTVIDLPYLMGTHNNRSWRVDLSLERDKASGYGIDQLWLNLRLTTGGTARLARVEMTRFDRWVHLPSLLNSLSTHYLIDQRVPADQYTADETKRANFYHQNIAPLSLTIDEYQDRLSHVMTRIRTMSEKAPEGQTVVTLLGYVPGQDLEPIRVTHTHVENRSTVHVHLPTKTMLGLVGNESLFTNGLNERDARFTLTQSTSPDTHNPRVKIAWSAPHDQTTRSKGELEPYTPAQRGVTIGAVLAAVLWTNDLYELWALAETGTMDYRSKSLEWEIT